MENKPQEGAGRPLYTSAPILPQDAAYLLEPTPRGALAVGALASYPLAYLYVRGVMDTSYFGWATPVFSVGYLVWVGLLARAAHRTPNREAAFWGAALLLQGFSMAMWGAQAGLLSVWQVLAWHLFAVWFALARTGMLAAGHSGSLTFLDALAGLGTLPWPGLFRRAGVLLRAVRRLFAKRPQQKNGEKRRFWVILASVCAALLLCALAWGQLAAVDANFAALGQRLWGWKWDWSWLQLASWAVYFVLSLPVGAWLFGLVANGLRRTAPPCTEKRFFAGLAPLQRLPAVTVTIVMGALCAVYGLFFAIQAMEFCSVQALGLTAPEASSFAVDGFWELCRILLLDFTVLAAVRFFGRAPLWKTPAHRALAALFCGFGVAFAALAGAKLATYIRLYGYTPRRVVSGWFLCVLAVWALLALGWVLRRRARFGAARAGVLVLAAGFVLLSCVNMDRQIVRANIARYRAGVDAELDTRVLMECGVGNWIFPEHGLPQQADYAQWLIDAGWFAGRPLDEVETLYLFDRSGLDGGTGTVEITLENRARLVLACERGACVGARLDSLPDAA